MSFSRDFTVIIPLRSGSKGLPNKNIMKFDGKPLYLHTADLAKEANASRIIITTNIEQVLQSKLDDRIEIIRRPERLCSDIMTMSPVLLHAVKYSKVQGTVVLLQPTSPLRSLEDLKASIDLFERSQSDLVLTVTVADAGVLKSGELSVDGFFRPISSLEHVFSNRQSLPPVFKPNGAVYVFNAQWLLKHTTLSNAKTISAVRMPEIRSHDIDTLEDFAFCQGILTNLGN